MARIRRDKHGLYIRQVGRIFRPEFSNIMFFEMCIRTSLTGGPNYMLYDHMIKRPSPYLFVEGDMRATCNPGMGAIMLYEHNYLGGRNTHREYWFDHGPWTGDSAASWSPRNANDTHPFFP